MSTTVTGDPRPILTHLRAGGVSVLLEQADGPLPVLRHWDADLGELSEEGLPAVAEAALLAHGDSPFDVADQVTMLPEHARAWVGRLSVVRAVRERAGELLEQGEGRARPYHPSWPRPVALHRWEATYFGRAATARWGHMGVEWDLTSCSQEELEQVAAWVRLHQEHRQLLHSGAVVNGDHHDDATHDDATWVHGMVAQGASEALFHVVAVRRASTRPDRVRLPGLDATQRYRPELLRPKHSQLWRVRTAEG